MFFLDDFFGRAIVAGVGFALIAGPLGCYVIWKRFAYFGDTIAHSALLGVALSLAFDLHILVGVLFMCIAVALILGQISDEAKLSRDSILGILSHSTLALGLVLVSLMYWIRVDILHLLFGNILAVSVSEIIAIYAVGLVVILLVVWKWKHFIALVVDEQIAAVENLEPQKTRYILIVSIAITIAFAMKIVGIILSVSLLIIPAAASRQITNSPEQMAVVASLIGALAVVGGLNASLEFDTPPGPSIVIAAMVIFLISALGGKLWSRRKPTKLRALLK